MANVCTNEFENSYLKDQDQRLLDCCAKKIEKIKKNQSSDSSEIEISEVFLIKSSIVKKYLITFGYGQPYSQPSKL